MAPAEGAGRQALIGQEQLLPGERGRVTEDGFQRAAPGLRSRGNKGTQARAAATKRSAARAAALQRRHP